MHGQDWMHGLFGVLAMTAVLAGGPAAARDNPLLARSPLFFDAPRFDLIKDSDWQPALEAAIREHAAEVARIADNPAPPDFANTIVALEASGRLLTNVTQTFFNVSQANGNAALDAAREAMAPKLQAHQDAILLNTKLFARVEAVYDKRATLKLDAKQAFLLENTRRNFVRAGVALPPAQKTALAALNQRIATLQNSYSTQLVAATDAAAVLVQDRARLVGLSAENLAAAADAAAAAGHKGAWLLRLQNTTRQPLLEQLADHGLRAELMAASQGRGGTGAHDLRPILLELAALRAQRAQMLGYPNFAAYTLAAQMAQTPQNAFKLLDGLVPAATARARREGVDIQAMIDRENGGFTATAADWAYYAQKVRAQKYDLDDAAIRPYFELNRVLHDGVFFAAEKLYGLHFAERTDIPVYNPDVRVFTIMDEHKHPIALFYADYFARPNKQGGAWCDNLQPPAGVWGQKSVVVNVTNFTKPAAGQPALISFDDVTTMFHEFGHALHTIFSAGLYPSQNGFGVPTDMVEFPSQFNEHWALEPEVFAHYARHYQTGAAMPADLAAKLKRARHFNQGYDFTEILAAALLDLEWHSIPAGTKIADASVFEAQALAKHKIDLKLVPPRYHSPYFQHIWGGGYAANYYSYTWGEILDDDAFEWFGEHGGMTRANGERFKTMMLAPGYSAEPMELYRAFRGRDPQVEALERNRGLIGSAD